MSDLLGRFELAVDAVARLGAYPYRERRPAWIEGLRAGLAELALFEVLRPQPECGFLSQPPSGILDGGMPVSEDAAGVASIARACRGAPGSSAAPALEALSRASRRKDLNAFISLADPAALGAAGSAAARRLRDGAPMPLMGVPVAVKDLMKVAGFPQTNGSGGTPPSPQARDCLAVARLREAGALIVGTTNLHELAFGVTSENPHHGHVVNPRGAGYTPGGSSGGSAAAVAAGIVSVAIGTDTGGSIRLPASCCGVVGFKPSFDAVPRDGVQSLGASLDHVGPIAASVDDAALMFSVMSGQSARVSRPAPLAGLRLGVPDNHFFDPLADDVARVVRATLARMRDDGATLVPVDLPGVEHSAALQFVTLCCEATELHWRTLVEHPETLGADVRLRLEIGQFLPATWYLRAQRGRAALATTFGAVMRNVDALVVPTLRIEPPRSGAVHARVGGRDIPVRTAVTALTMPFNLTGMPALTLPCGRGDNGLPIGIQIAAGRGDDWRVLDVGARLEYLLNRTDH